MAERCAYPLLLLLALAAPALAQEEPGEWRVDANTRLRLEWTYSFAEQTHHSDEGKTYRKEARAVSALLTSEEGFRRTGSFVVTVETVAWTVDTESYFLTLTKDADGEPKLRHKVKDKDTEAFAKGEADEMLEYSRAEYRLLVRPGSASMQVKTPDGWSGGADAASIFNRCYLYSDLPDEELKSNLKWVDERENEYLPLYAYPGNVDEHAQVKLKLQLGPTGLRAKGKGSVSFSGRTLLNWKYIGKSVVERSFECSAQGHLLASAETAKGTIRRTNQTKPGKSGGTIVSEQSLTVSSPEH